MLLLTVSLANASAYYFLDSGTRAIGRGGAFVAGADDLSAQYYNPAALANIDRPMFNFNYWQVEQYVLFDRADETGEDPFAPVENIAPPIPEPSGGYAAPLGGIHPALKNTTAAFGLYVPTSPYMAYPEDGAQRYSLIDSLIWQIYAGPSVAQRITPWLTVGAGLQYTFLRVEQQLAATICYTEEGCAEGSDDPANDITIDLKTWDWSQFSGNAGILVQPTPWLDIGLSVQPPIEYAAPGSLTASFNEDFSLASQLDGLEFTDDDVTVLVKVPMILRGGVQLRPTETVRVEAAGSYTAWGSLDELRVTDMDLQVDGNPDGLAPDGFLVTDDIVFKTGYVDSFSARLGGDYLIAPGSRKLNARVSAGVHYESSAVPPETQGVTLVDGSKWGFGLGTTVTLFDRVALDLSGAKQFLADRTITDSQLRQQALYANLTDPEATSVVEGKVVGNGEFASNLTFLAAGITVYTGKRREVVPRRAAPPPVVAPPAPVVAAVAGSDATWQGHTDAVRGALMLSGGRILSWSADRTLRLWDAATVTPTATLEGHTGAVVGALALSGARILSWSADHTLRLWDSESGAPIRTLEGHTGAVVGALVVSNARILSWSVDGTLRLWDSETGEPVACLQGHTSEVLGADTLPGGRILSWSADHTMRVWDADTGALIDVLAESSAAPSVVRVGKKVTPITDLASPAPTAPTDAAPQP